MRRSTYTATSLVLLLLRSVTINFQCGNMNPDIDTSNTGGKRVLKKRDTAKHVYRVIIGGGG